MTLWKQNFRKPLRNKLCWTSKISCMKFGEILNFFFFIYISILSAFSCGVFLIFFSPDITNPQAFLKRGILQGILFKVIRMTLKYCITQSISTRKNAVRRGDFYLNENLSPLCCSSIFSVSCLHVQ